MQLWDSNNGMGWYAKDYYIWPYILSFDLQYAVRLPARLLLLLAIGYSATCSTCCSHNSYLEGGNKGKSEMHAIPSASTQPQ